MDGHLLAVLLLRQRRACGVWWARVSCLLRCGCLGLLFAWWATVSCVLRYGCLQVTVCHPDKGQWHAAQSLPNLRPLQGPTGQSAQRSAHIHGRSAMHCMLPLSVPEAKLFLELKHSSDNLFIQSFLRALVPFVESAVTRQVCGPKYVPQTWC